MMARNPKLKSKAGTKFVNDTTQRKLSFYLKKNDSKANSSVPQVNADKANQPGNKSCSSMDSKVSIASSSPMVTEIPPTPDRTGNFSKATSALSKSRLALFSHNVGCSEPVGKNKRELDNLTTTENKRLKLSTKKQKPVSSKNAQCEKLKMLSDASTAGCISSKLLGKENEEFCSDNVQQVTEELFVADNAHQNYNKLLSESPAKNKNMFSKSAHRINLNPLSNPTKETISKDSVQNVSPKKLYTVLRTPTKNNAHDCKKTMVSTEMSDDLDWELDFDPELLLTPKKMQNNVVPKSNTSHYTVTNAEKRNDGFLLTLKSSSDVYTRQCLLKDSWRDTLVENGNSVSVLSDFDDSGFTVINNNKGFLVINNDILVSSTSITSMMFCSRKTVLAERFRGWDTGNQAMFLGNAIHDLFQRVALRHPMSIDELKMEFLKVIRSMSYLHELYGLGLTEAAIQHQALPYFPSILSWINQYCSINPSPLCQETKDVSEEVLAQVATVHDIEDNIWCTKYGIKGKVDLTVDVKLHKRKEKGNKLMPLELKTGKPSFSDEHQGQVILYSLMMADRLKDPGGGLLLYLSEGPKMKFIEANRNKERGLVQLRNELSYYFKYLHQDSGSLCVLPEPISRNKVCQKCPFVLPCSMLENKTESYKPGKERNKLVEETTLHLSLEHKAYFSKWYVMLQREFECQHKKQRGKAFWLENAETRESKGTCLSNLILDESTVVQVDRHFSLTFCKEGSLALPSDTSIVVGDFVIVSSTIKPEVCITMGSITSITPSSITVLVDKDLTKRITYHKGELYRLDQNFSTAAFDTSFRNLLKLMQNNGDSQRLRNTIIDLSEPRFKKGLKKELALKLKPFLKILNVAQQRAVLKLLMAEDFVLLQGMPGTGKTATIVSLVQVLVALGFSVLLTSYTHSAVDNVLLRLHKRDVKFVRLGQPSKIHPEIKQYGADCLTKGINSVEELNLFYSSVPVVATTCLGLNHPVFKQRTFDYCIVDETSQILQTACLGPLFHSNVFVLVGDSKQLPPVVNSKEASEMGLGESLFKRLESPSCTFELNIQYRMNSEIMRLCNELTYDGKLVIGSEEVGKATLKLDNVPTTVNEHWFRRIFSTDLSDSALFLNTDFIDSPEVSDSTSISNPTEVKMVSFITNEFIKAGVSPDNVGVISFYRKQVQLLSQELCAVNVEVNTVDKYQGRDKNVVIISCVRSSENPVVSEILMDERRLNVALTRAKHKLVIVGSRRTMLNYTPFTRLFKCLRDEQVVALNKLPLPIV